MKLKQIAFADCFSVRVQETTDLGDFMKFNRQQIFRFAFIAIFILSVFDAAIAQSSGKLEIAAVKYAKNYLVSGIEDGLPPKSFGAWFRELVGAKTPVTWETNDCGEQTGTSADRGRDFPMCVQASAKMSANSFVSVNIQYGTFKRGVTRGKPAVRYISIGEEGAGEYIESLTVLQNRLLQMPQDTDFFDPNGGEFIISDDRKPAGFEDFREMYLLTREDIQDKKSAVVKPNGAVESWKHQLFAMRNIFFDGKRWSFETAAIGGVSYKFDGKFIKIKRYADGAMDSQDVLKGRLIKFVGGKESASADLIFSFQVADDN
jgi:hypothetical protein